MPFDFDLAVARIDANAGDFDSTAMSALRLRYPEIDFVFDAVGDLRAADSRIDALLTLIEEAYAALYALYALGNARPSLQNNILPILKLLEKEL